MAMVSNKNIWLDKFSPSLYNNGDLDLTEHLFKALDHYEVKHTRTNLPCGIVGNNSLKQYCVKTIKLNIVWRENGGRFPWEYIMDEIKHRCTKFATPIIY